MSLAELLENSVEVPCVKSFVGSSGEGELSLSRGESVFVFRRSRRNERDVWWEGYNITGLRGSFPDWAIDSTTLTPESLRTASLFHSRVSKRIQQQQQQQQQGQKKEKKVSKREEKSVKEPEEEILLVGKRLVVPGVLYLEEEKTGKGIEGRVKSLRVETCTGSTIPAVRDSSGRLLVEIKEGDDLPSTRGLILHAVYERPLTGMERCVTLNCSCLFHSPGTVFVLQELGFAALWFEQKTHFRSARKIEKRVNMSRQPEVSGSINVWGCDKISVLLKRAKVKVTVLGVLGEVVAEACTEAEDVIDGKLQVHRKLDIHHLSYSALLFGSVVVELVKSKSDKLVAKTEFPLGHAFSLLKQKTVAEAFSQSDQHRIRFSLPLESQNRLGTVRVGVIDMYLRLDADTPLSPLASPVNSSLMEVPTLQKMEALIDGAEHSILSLAEEEEAKSSLALDDGQESESKQSIVSDSFDIRGDQAMPSSPVTYTSPTTSPTHQEARQFLSGLLSARRLDSARSPDLPLSPGTQRHAKQAGKALGELLGWNESDQPDNVLSPLQTPPSNPNGSVYLSPSQASVRTYRTKESPLGPLSPSQSEYARTPSQSPVASWTSPRSTTSVQLAPADVSSPATRPPGSPLGANSVLGSPSSPLLSPESLSKSRQPFPPSMAGVASSPLYQANEDNDILLEAGMSVEESGYDSPDARDERQEDQVREPRHNKKKQRGPPTKPVLSHGVPLSDPGTVAMYLFEQERIEAVKRALGGCMFLSRELLWRIVADLGLWDPLAVGLGRLPTDAEIIIPLLDNKALASKLGQPEGSLIVKQLQKGLLDLLRVQDVEKAYEKWLLAELEFVANGIDESPEAVKARTKASPYLSPLSHWDTKQVLSLFRAAGWNPSSQLNKMPNQFTGSQLEEMESEGMYSLQEKLLSLSISDSVVRQRIQFQISLQRIRSDPLSRALEGLPPTAPPSQQQSNQQSDDDDEDEQDSSVEKELQDVAWWAGTSFGVRAKKQLEKWTVEDVQQYLKTLRLSGLALDRVKAFAIDGRSLMDLTERDMDVELGLNPAERRALEASILLLSRPPEVDLGFSRFLRLRAVNSHSAIWFDDASNMFMLARERVHTFILRPKQLLTKAALRLQDNLSLWKRKYPAMRIWFRVLEYSTKTNKTSKDLWLPVGPERKRRKNTQQQTDTGQEENRWVSFTDAGETSVASVLRKKLKEERSHKLTRYDPLHPLVYSQASIVNEWRYLTTTSVLRGVDTECARVSVCFNNEALAKTRDPANTYYRLCFAVQIGTFDGMDQPMNVCTVPIKNDPAGKSASHFFSLSPGFRMEPLASSSKKAKKKKKPKMRMKTTQATTQPKRPAFTVGESRNQPPVRPVKPKRKPPTVNPAPVIQQDEDEEGNSFRRRKFIYSEDFQRERLERLEKTQRAFEEEILWMKDKERRKEEEKAIEERNRKVRNQAALELGHLLGATHSEQISNQNVSIVTSKASPSAHGSRDKFRHEARTKIQVMSETFAGSPTRRKETYSVEYSEIISPSESENSVLCSPAASPSSRVRSPSVSVCSMYSSESKSSWQDWSSKMLYEKSSISPGESGIPRVDDWTVDVKQVSRKEHDIEEDQAGEEENINEDNTAAKQVGEAEDTTSLWADRIKSRFLDKEILTYPLRPAPAFSSESQFQGLKSAVCREKAEICLSKLAVLDTFSTGWLDQHSFLEFSREMGFGHQEKAILENLAWLETQQLDLETSSRRPVLVSRKGDTMFVRYEKLIYNWTKDGQALANAVGKRLWRLAELKEFELLYFIETAKAVKLSDLQELDPDLDEEDVELLLHFKSPGEYLQSALLRSNRDKFWDALVSILREREKEALDIFTRFDLSSADHVSVEHFARSVQRLLDLMLTEEELEFFAERSGSGKPGHVAYHALFDIPQNVGLFDAELILEHAKSVDTDGSGLLDPNDMYQALRSSLKSNRPERGLVEKARELSLDYEKRKVQYTKWIEMTFKINHESVVRAELFRLGKWFGALEAGYRKTFLDSVGKTAVMQYEAKVPRKKLEATLSDFGFSTNYLFDLSQVVEAESAGDCDFEVLLKAAIDAANVASLEQNYFRFRVLNRLISRAGGMSKVLQELAFVDREGTGSLAFKTLSKVLHCRSKELEMVFPDKPATVLYEGMLQDLILAIGEGETYAKSFTFQKIRRAMRRCYSSSGLSLFDHLLAQDEPKVGCLSIFQLSWELRVFQVFLESDGPEAAFLLSQYGMKQETGETWIDYESLLHAVELEDAVTSDEKRRLVLAFTLQFFRREIVRGKKYVGMYHVFDSAFDLVNDVSKTGLCSQETFRKVLRMAFSYTDVAKLEKAIASAEELFRVGQHVGYEKFAFETGSGSLGETNFQDDVFRHKVNEVVRATRDRQLNLYDMLRASDGDLDGTISRRNFQRTLATLGVPTLCEGSLNYLDVLNEEGSVRYELFVERAEAVCNNIEPVFSAGRLLSTIKRVSARIAKDKGLRSSKEVFVSLLESSERARALNEWDLFFLLREHGVIGAHSAADLAQPLRRILSLPENAPLEIDSVHWMRIHQ